MAREKNGVVDHKLIVHGLESLRWQISVFLLRMLKPIPVGLFVIGERAAGLVIQDLGLGRKQVEY